MSDENVVFRKIKEMSSRVVHPRPALNTSDLARELSVSPESLTQTLDQLKDLRLISFFKPDHQSIKLTLLGTVVVRKN
jgi:Mn-dependent DtxR family transcriptional regulator